jgi:hypothetical protein
MDQLPKVDSPTVHDAPTGRPGADWTPSAADLRLDRASQLVLKVGVAMSTVFVLLPGVGLAAVMVFLASLQTWHGGEGEVAVEDRQLLLSVALLATGFVVACAVLLRRSLRRGWIALALVGLGGLACIYTGARGIIEATGIDNVITALSWCVGATGVVLVLGASLGTAVRLRGEASHRTS